MNKKFLVLAALLVLTISLILIQDLPAPISTCSPSSAISASASTVNFSLWFPNGTAYSLNQINFPLVLGASDLDANGIYTNVQVGMGAPSGGYVVGAVVLRNDGDSPIYVNATLENVNVPSSVNLLFNEYAINPSLYGSELEGWMGYGNLASLSTYSGFVSNVTVNSGQYIWLGLTVIMTGTLSVQNPSGNVPPNPFIYSFDVSINATSTSNGASTSQQTIHVTNN